MELGNITDALGYTSLVLYDLDGKICSPPMRPKCDRTGSLANISYMVSLSSQMLPPDLYFLSGQILFRTSMRCLLLFILLFLYGFFENLCFLFLILYYEYCGNPVVLAGLNRFTITALHSSCYV